jgi:uncharacterized Fe-S center protein
MSSLDPVALDAACYDWVLKAAGGKDPFISKGMGLTGETQLAHGEKIGLGSRTYTAKEI